jgi:elongator complex protein 3
LARHRPELVPEPRSLRAALRKKPVRSLSGVAVVTVLTRPHPCPGRCLFCPADVRMPKSYLSEEPGSQRAASHHFDPYRQTFARLLALHRTGHRLDKVELLVLGGTWSSYPEPYQRGFLTRCFQALEDFGAAAAKGEPRLPAARTPRVRFDRPGSRIDGREISDGETESPYNRVVAKHLRGAFGGRLGTRGEAASWEGLHAAQRRNETAGVRCVGLALETRPDCVTDAEVRRLRRLGATRIQLGVQSLSDPVLAANRRGHDRETTRRAFARLRRAGFKIVAHWMPNLLGSSPERDRADFDRLFGDSAFRPDELKIYPCSLVESAELMRHWESGAWRPYSEEELLSVLVHALPRVPPYCRLARVVRDIPGTDIVTGNRTTNFRQVVEAELARRRVALHDIRSREIRDREPVPDEIRVEEIRYSAGGAQEVFLQGLTPESRLVGFLRLSLPREGGSIPEIAASAMIREVHVYGAVVGLGRMGEERSAVQHQGLGRRLVERAARLAAGAGFGDLAVISSVGTREYYRDLGFRDDELYQHRPLTGRVPKEWAGGTSS